MIIFLYLCTDITQQRNNMENPFVFGKAAEGAYFTDRVEDSKRLAANLTHGINTVLISPRRWGKTSLVKKVISETSSEDVKFIFIDVFQCKSEYDFFRNYANEVIKQTSSKIDEWVEMAKNFQNPETVESILALPEKLAVKKSKRIVVCLDEFQQIADFADSTSFQKRLRTAWQHQQHTTYCMFGSKKHLMEYIFNDKSMPFYKFGDMIFLNKISTEDWTKYICRQFHVTGKTINEDQAEKICNLTENLSSYVQHLSWIVWYKTDRVVTNKIINDALDDILEQNKVFFQREVEQLTELQLNFLKALACGVTSGFSRKEVIQKYRLESSANIQSVKKALLKKDLIYIDDATIVFDDPLMKLWIKREF